MKVFILIALACKCLCLSVNGFISVGILNGYVRSFIVMVVNGEEM